MYRFLREDQEEIVKQSIEKQRCIISIPMGGGKTRISLTLSKVIFHNIRKPILVVLPKVLLSVWEEEIKKTFDSDLKYQILYPEYVKLQDFELDIDTELVLTTVDMCKKVVKDYNIKERLYKDVIVNDHRRMHFDTPKHPILNIPSGLGVIYSIEWGGLICDEIQEFSNIKTLKTRCLIGVCAKYRYATSGTFINEPKPSVVFGLLKILGLDEHLHSIVEFNEALKYKAWYGYKRHLVERQTMKGFTLPAIEFNAYEHRMLENELKMCNIIHSLVAGTQEKAKIARLRGDSSYKELNFFCIALISFYRMMAVFPKIAYTSKTKMEQQVRSIIIAEAQKQGLEEWCYDVSSHKSSRIRETEKICNAHIDCKIIIFSSFRVLLIILEFFLKELDTTILRLDSDMNIAERQNIIDDFRKLPKSILLMTYKLGACGLNLQDGNVVILLDQCWNDATVSQAICRVYRQGNINTKIIIYVLYASLGIENDMFKKQKSKKLQIQELGDGILRTKITKINMNTVGKITESVKTDISFVNEKTASKTCVNYIRDIIEKIKN